MAPHHLIGQGKAAQELNARGIPTSAGGKWHATQDYSCSGEPGPLTHASTIQIQINCCGPSSAFRGS